jgi:hypothetical protein
MRMLSALPLGGFVLQPAWSAHSSLGWGIGT